MMEKMDDGLLTKEPRDLTKKKLLLFALLKAATAKAVFVKNKN